MVICIHVTGGGKEKRDNDPSGILGLKYEKYKLFFIYNKHF